MMSGVPLETCWAFKKLWNNKFYYNSILFYSCWYFYWVIYAGRIHECQKLQQSLCRIPACVTLSIQCEFTFVGSNLVTNMFYSVLYCSVKFRLKNNTASGEFWNMCVIFTDWLMVTLVWAEKSGNDIKQNISFIRNFVLVLFAFKFYFILLYLFLNLLNILFSPDQTTHYTLL
jgi:hypothetical protein